MGVEARHRPGDWLVDLVFYTGLALLFTHELDAVEQNEWLFLPVLAGLAEPEAFTAFVALHVPLFALLMWLTSRDSQRIRRWARWIVDGFMIVHLPLHLMNAGHESYTFHSPLSHALIFGAAAIGLLHLVLTLWARRSARK